MAMEKIHTYHGNFAEVTRKAVNAANQVRSRMFGKINPQDRVGVIREQANLLMEYADCLEQIWDKEKEIQGTNEEKSPYIKIERGEPENADIS